VNELVDATAIRVGDRIIRHQRPVKVTRIKNYTHANDNTLEFRTFSEARGYEDIWLTALDMIFRVVEERPRP
jgi:hypothetical protein